MKHVFRKKVYTRNVFVKLINFQSYPESSYQANSTWKPLHNEHVKPRRIFYDKYVRIQERVSVGVNITTSRLKTIFPFAISHFRLLHLLA